MNDGLPPLPALKHLGNLADRLPTVIIDTREQEPLPITRLPVIRADAVDNYRIILIVFRRVKALFSESASVVLANNNEVTKSNI